MTSSKRVKKNIEIVDALFDKDDVVINDKESDNCCLEKAPKSDLVSSEKSVDIIDSNEELDKTEKKKRGGRKSVAKEITESASDVPKKTSSRAKKTLSNHEDVDSNPCKEVKKTRTRTKKIEAPKPEQTTQDEVCPKDVGTTNNTVSEEDQFGAFTQDIIAAEDIDDAAQLAECLLHIQDLALKIHEQFEERSCPLLRWFEQNVFGVSRRVQEDAFCTVVWNCLLFTQARLVEQKNFQTRIVSSLPDAEHALIMRQISCNAPRVWSYRRSYQRSFAHTINGPNKTREISLNGSLTAWGSVHRDVHLYAYGWLVTYHDKSWLISAAELTREQAACVESIHPYPLHHSDNLFWEEMFIEILQAAYETRPILDNTNQRKNVTPALTDYAPELFFSRLQKLIFRQMNGNGGVRHAGRDIHEIIARNSSNDIQYAAKCAVQEFTSSPSPSLVVRFLDAFGCDEDGNLPQAHPMILANDPTALLLLPNDLPIFKSIHERDPIKAALKYETENGEDQSVHQAFEQYTAEKRWLMSYSGFDLGCEEHAMVVGLPMDSIKNVFDPRLADSRLPIVPPPDYLKQLQDKFGMYLENEELPMFKDVLNALTSRRIQRGGTCSPIVQWFFNCCQRWRNCLSEIETITQPVCRMADSNSQKLLSNGLSGLAAMFKKNKTSS